MKQTTEHQVEQKPFLRLQNDHVNTQFLSNVFPITWVEILKAKGVPLYGNVTCRRQPSYQHSTRHAATGGEKRTTYFVPLVQFDAYGWRINTLRA